jgi:hypothetical protein
LVHGITQIQPGDRLVITEDVAELTGRDTLGGQVDFGTYGPAPTPPASRIGIRIFRRNAGLPGPLFRSGFLGSLPPTTAALPELEVVEAPWFLLDERTLNDTLQTNLPRTVDGTTINSASVVIEEGTVRVRTQGTRPGGPLGTIGFTVNGPFAAMPVSTMSPVEDGAQWYCHPRGLERRWANDADVRAF